MKIDQVCHYLVLNYLGMHYFMLFTNNIHIFQLMYIYAYYIHIVDTYMAAVCINDYMIMFDVYITALVCFNGCVRAATLIADRLQIITDSSCSDY